MADAIEWVSYHPPKSRSFGHAPRFRDKRKAWATTKSFLAEFTNPIGPPEITSGCRAPSQWLTAEVADKRRAEAQAVLGAPDREDAINGAHWVLSIDRLEDAMEFEIAGPPKQKDMLPPSDVRVSYKFRWRAPWDRPDNPSFWESGLAFDVSGGSALIQPMFVFFAPLVSNAFREQFLALEPSAPFKFNDTYFKRWIINPKRGGVGRFLKADKDWRSVWQTS